MDKHLATFDHLLEAQHVLEEALIEQLWGQWRLIGAGAAAGSATASTPAMIDPEALVLASLLHSRREPRLGDLISDWATRNVDLLSVQRIRNLLPTYPGDLQEVLASRLAWLAEIAVQEGADSRWRPLLIPAVERDPMPLRSGGKRAVRARVTTPSCLLLSLRLGLGVGAKADIVAFLLGRPELHTVREITQGVGYTVSAVRRGVEELAEAGWVERRDGQPAHYRAHWSRWHSLLGLDNDGTPRWSYWHQRFVLVAAFGVFWEHLAREMDTSPPAPSAVGTEMRLLLETHREVLGQLEVTSWGAHQPVRDWLAFGAEVMGRLARGMAP